MAQVVTEPADKKLNYFERYLSVWVGACMFAGVCSICSRTRHWFPVAAPENDVSKAAVRAPAR